MHNPEYVLEYGTHKILYNFEIQTNHQIIAQSTVALEYTNCFSAEW